MEQSLVAFPKRGEKLLLERAISEERLGKADSALSIVHVLLALAPRSLAAHDRAGAAGLRCRRRRR